MAIKIDVTKDGSKRYYCPVEDCIHYELSFEQLKNHVTSIHDFPLLKNECARCGRLYKTIRGLVKHDCPLKLKKINPFIIHNTRQTTLKS